MEPTEAQLETLVRRGRESVQVDQVHMEDVVCLVTEDDVWHSDGVVTWRSGNSSIGLTLAIYGGGLIPPLAPAQGLDELLDEASYSHLAEFTGTHHAHGPGGITHSASRYHNGQDDFGVRVDLMPLFDGGALHETGPDGEPYLVRTDSAGEPDLVVAALRWSDVLSWR